MAEALDAAADVYEVGGWDARFEGDRTLRSAFAAYLPDANMAREHALTTILSEPEENAWLLQALALGLRRDAERLDQKGDA